jgi:ferredoxin
MEPPHALFVTNDNRAITATVLRACGLCVSACPENAITLQRAAL